MHPYILNNTRRTFRNPSTKVFFEVDIWIPSLKLGFEFQVCSNTNIVNMIKIKREKERKKEIKLTCKVGCTPLYNYLVQSEGRECNPAT